MARLNKIDVLAGLFVILIGVISIVEAINFDLGTPRRIGPGFFPYYIGFLMLLIGVGIILESLRAVREELSFGQLPRLRGLLLVLAGVVAFALTIERFGMAPATAIAVFLGTLADDSTPWLQKILLTIAVPIVSVLIFSYGLGLSTDVLRWRP